jgi:hypothetical protein
VVYLFAGIPTGAQTPRTVVKLVLSGGERVSPSPQANDRRVKFDAYARSGVREPWIVDSKEKAVETYDATDGRFELRIKSTSGLSEPVVLHGCSARS